jgi:hypothetical protein
LDAPTKDQTNESVTQKVKEAMDGIGNMTNEGKIANAILQLIHDSYNQQYLSEMKIPKFIEAIELTERNQVTRCIVGFMEGLFINRSLNGVFDYLAVGNQTAKNSGEQPQKAMSPDDNQVLGHMAKGLGVDLSDIREYVNYFVFTNRNKDGLFDKQMKMMDDNKVNYVKVSIMHQ